MDQVALVERQITDGQKLIDRLVAAGFDVAAAAWVNAADESRWHLYLASKSVDEDGRSAGYHSALAVLRSATDLWLDSFDLKLVGRNSPIGKALVSIQNGRTMPTRYRGLELGNLPIEDVYIYPLPASAAAAGS